MMDDAPILLFPKNIFSSIAIFPRNWNDCLHITEPESEPPSSSGKPEPGKNPFWLKAIQWIFRILFSLSLWRWTNFFSFVDTIEPESEPVAPVSEPESGKVLFA